ncbi:hypothetical protein C2S51_009711 [Perilla frutescens var. frutescens]|nr:hypothetical protein C2S51_009711 [Perilla frutescens var. frutescens]
MDEEPVMIHENSGDEREECIAEKEQNAIVADNELDIDILDNSGDENHEHNDENEQSITLIQRVNTFDLSGSLIGFKRESFKEMYELYCLHAREVGFSVKKNTQRRNSTGAVTEKYYVCSSEGVRNNTTIVPLSNQEKKWTRRRNITCTNCKASLRVRRGQDGLLEVIEHVQEHNHELSRKEWSHRHRSQRSITDDKVVRIEDLISSGMRASDSYRYMAKKQGVFKKSMKLKCPITIFTDQDDAITNALSKNAVSRFGRLKGNKDFNDAFQRYLTRCVNKEEFERCWASMISDHGLGDNSWFARLYDLREKCKVRVRTMQLDLRQARLQICMSSTQFSREQSNDGFECSKAIPNSRIPLTGMLKHASEKDMWDKIANSSDQIAGLMDFNGWRHNMARNYYSILIKGQESEEARIIIEEGSKSIFDRGHRCLHIIHKCA